MFKFIKRLVGLGDSIKTVKQARAARKLEAKRRRKAGTYSHGRPYAWGALGLSMVSAAIKKDYGMILSRRERKEAARSQGIQFKAYYNGR